jgi:hypothetical protein
VNAAAITMQHNSQHGLNVHAPTLSQQGAAASNNEIAKNKWAYVYLIAGVDVRNPGYKGIFTMSWYLRNSCKTPRPIFGNVANVISIGIFKTDCCRRRTSLGSHDCENQKS